MLLLCTGYNYTFPYLRGPALGLEVRRELVSPLYRFLLPPAFPSLFIIGVCKLILPFPHFHCQVSCARTRGSPARVGAILKAEIVTRAVVAHTLYVSDHRWFKRMKLKYIRNTFC